MDSKDNELARQQQERRKRVSRIKTGIKHLYGAFFLDITGFFAFSVVGCPIP